MIYFGEFEEFLKEASEVSSAVLKVQGIPANCEIELCMVDSEEIHQINIDARGVDKPTDVLSFPTLELFEEDFEVEDHPLDINPENGNLFLGSIIICKEIMEKQAEEYGTGKREFYYMLVHGTLHLLGYDHMQEEEKSRMRKREEEILAEIL